MSLDIAQFEPPLSATGWRVYRIVPSVFPPVSIFDRVADPADLEALYLVESMTNDRLRQEAGDVSLVPVEDRVTGPGSTPIMAAFTHLNPDGARFSDATFSVYYAGLELATAVAETKHHREQFLAATNEGPIDIDMRVYVARIDGEFHDLRTGAPDAIYDPDNYAISQALARRLRAQHSNGLIYNSVRQEGGTCIAAFRPRLLSDCCQERHLAYRWDGKRISDIYEKRSFDAEQA